MSRLPIRLRLTAAFALAMALVLVILGFVIYTRFEDSLLDNVDRSLESRAADIEAVLEREGPQLPEVGGETLVEREESFAQVLDPDARVIDATARVDRPLLSGDETQRAARGPLTLDREDGGIEEGDPTRLLAVPLVVDGERLVLVVGTAMDDNEESLGTLRLLLGIGLPLALLLASLAGYGVAAAALRPVEAMRRKAAGITEASPGQRLPVPDVRDEIGRLGETLNAMLARLDEALQRERAFVADASHELRTPLAILKTELELALREGRTEQELRDALRSASDETDRVSRLADDLLVLARSDGGTLPLRIERLAVGELLAGVAERFRTTGHDVELEVPEGLELGGDRLRLEQAIGNLVANAVTHGEGRITLSAHRANGAVELHVVDQGTGLPGDFADRAFERFTRADSARTSGGAGLGLAIVKAVATAHGGTARASGADVWMVLPALIGDSSRLRTQPL